MSLAVLEEVLEKVNQLTLEEQAKVCEAIEQNVQQANGDKTVDWSQATPEEIEKERQRRLALSEQIMGKYKDLMPDPELRAKWKAEEIELEDKGWQPK